MGFKAYVLGPSLIAAAIVSCSQFGAEDTQPAPGAEGDTEDSSATLADASAADGNETKDCGAVLVPVLVILHHDPLPYEIAGVLVGIIVWWAHRGNIRRLLKGTESRVTLPWSGKRSTVAGSGGGRS